jgi:quinoprotein glucose dehydrogenase
VFLLERGSGAPLFPIEERPVPASDVPGEWTSPTQPFPTRPPPLVPIGFSEAGLWDVSPEHLAFCRDWLRRLRNDGIFTPPSTRGSLIYPSYGGGANWSGGAADPGRGILYAPVNDVVIVVRVEMPSRDALPRGALPRALARVAPWRVAGPRPELHDERFMHEGLPCKAPPWGHLVAVDMNRGEILWRVPAGRERDGSLGLSNMGPPLVTAGGLVFHAGTSELRMRAHDAETGAELASFALPAGLHAGPITYKLRPGGRQFLVIAPGGHFTVGRWSGTQPGDYVIAYALPD